LPPADAINLGHLGTLTRIITHPIPPITAHHTPPLPTIRIYHYQCPHRATKESSGGEYPCIPFSLHLCTFVKTISIFVFAFFSSVVLVFRDFGSSLVAQQYYYLSGNIACVHARVLEVMI
jgi:hypothetical protein